MKLAEPVTAITDYILAAEALVFFAILMGSNSGQHSVSIWAIGFAMLAISSLTGGTFHGFEPVLTKKTHTMLQDVTALAITAALIFFMIAGVISAFVGPLRISLIVLAFAPMIPAVLFIQRKTEPIAVRNTAPVLWGIFAVLAILFIRHVIIHGARSGYFVFIGGLIVMAGAATQQQQFVIHRKFNENDLCHVILMIGIYFLYRGGSLLRDAMTQ